MAKADKPVKAEKPAKKDKKNKPGLIKRFTTFLKSVWSEMKKVTWPTRKELLQHTSVVMGIVLILSLIVYVIDVGLGGLLSLIIR